MPGQFVGAARRRTSNGGSPRLDTRGSYDVPVSTVAEQPNGESHLHLFTLDDPRLWEFRSRLSLEEFTIPDLSDEEWDSFHAIIAEG